AFRRFQFSNVSCLLIALFLALHAYGAHYTYAETPLGFWLRDALGLSRNHYDRIVHFSYGLLLSYPLCELGRRVLRLKRFWAYLIPLLVVLALRGGHGVVGWWG